MPREDRHLFRFPNHNAGETLDKRRPIAAILARRGYRVAEVTISFHDWAFHDPYARCLERGDGKSVEWLKATYLAQAEKAIDGARAESRAIYGRDIAQVMLLHLGDMNSVMTKPLLDLLRRKSFDVVPLAEAERDPAYETRPDVAMPGGSMLFGQVRAERKLPEPPQAESFLPKLAEVCK
jgi:hypothetical protein